MSNPVQCFPALCCRLCDRAFQNVQSKVRLELFDDQRWHQPDGTLSAAQDQNAQFEGALDGPVAHLRMRLPAWRIFDQLDADHQSLPPDVADIAMFRRPALKPV